MVAESVIRSIVDSVVYGLLSESYVSLESMLSRFTEQIPEDIGYLGGVERRLCKLEDFFGVNFDDIAYEYDEYYDNMAMQYDTYQEETTEEDISDFSTFLSARYPKLAKIYDNYSRAMSRRRPDSVLGEYNFMQYALAYADAFVFKSTVILGQFSNGYFKVSHFCPSTLMEGVEAIKELCKYDNIIFTVTEDLAAMLQKIGLYGHDETKIPMFFRGQLVMKNFYTTDRDLLEHFLNELNGGNVAEMMYSLVDGYNDTDMRSTVRGGQRHRTNPNGGVKQRLPMRYRSQKRSSFKEY